MSIKLINLTPWIAAREIPSPNFSARARKYIIGVVFHHTAGSDASAESWMASRKSEVSCHLHFRRDGSPTRMVDDAQRAWHAGSGKWRGYTDVNGVTLGWEIGNFGNGVELYTDAQYAELANVSAHYIKQGLTFDDFTSHDFTADGIIGGGRKVDPVGFDWQRWRRETEARLAGVPLLEPVAAAAGIPHRVWSGWFEEHLIVMKVISDSEWLFVRESQLAGLQVNGSMHRATTPLSLMPPARGA